MRRKMVANWPWIPFVIDLELAIFRGSMLGFDKLSFKAQTANTLQESLITQSFDQVCQK
jgi:hypothetical protein